MKNNLSLKHKLAAAFIGIFLANIVMLYGVCALVFWDLNPANWHIAARLVALIGIWFLTSRSYSDRKDEIMIE